MHPCQPVTEWLTFSFFVARHIFRIFWDVWVLRDPTFPAKSKENNGLAGTHRTRTQPIRIYIQNTVWTFGLLCRKHEKIAGCLVNYLVLVWDHLLALNIT